MSWQKAIILNPNEQVLHSWDGNCERQHKAVVAQKGLITTHYATVQSKEIHSGTLVLTNQRLLWFERRGLMSKTMRASYQILLNALQGITSGGAINKWVSIVDNEAEYIFHLRGIGSKEMEPFRDMILRQVEKVKGGNSETLNVNIRKEIKQEIIQTENNPIWNCKYCKGINFQKLTECKHCGAPRTDDSEVSFSANDPLHPIKQNSMS